MLIIWGTKRRKEDGGIVGDWCQNCNCAAAFRLTHYYTVGHVYYIPLGKGDLKGTSRQCSNCGAESVCDPNFYVNRLSVEDAASRHVAEIVRLTNPHLDDYLRTQYALPAPPQLQLPPPEIPPMGYDLGPSHNPETPI